MTETFYVWVLHDKRKVIVDDIGQPYVSDKLELIAEIEDDWFKAKDIGDAKAKELGYVVDYDNFAGRWAESQFDLDLDL